MENNKSENKEKTSSKEENPVDQGKEAIEVGKKTSGKPKEEAAKEDKKDAEKWRNEG